MVALKLGKLLLLAVAGSGELLSRVHLVHLYLMQKVELSVNFMEVVLLVLELSITISLIIMVD